MTASDALRMLGDLDPFRPMAAPSKLDPCFSCLGYRGPGHRSDCRYASLVPEADRRGERNAAKSMEHVQTHRDDRGAPVHIDEYIAAARHPFPTGVASDAAMLARAHLTVVNALRFDEHTEAEAFWTAVAAEYARHRISPVDTLAMLAAGSPGASVVDAVRAGLQSLLDGDAAPEPILREANRLLGNDFTTSSLPSDEPALVETDGDEAGTVTR